MTTITTPANNFESQVNQHDDNDVRAESMIFLWCDDNDAGGNKIENDLRSSNVVPQNDLLITITSYKRSH